MQKIHSFGLVAAILVLAGCESNIQTSSGSDYLARYAAYDTTDASALERADLSNSEIDAAVREVAMIEPHFELPARIGLARIQRGGLTTIPTEEGSYWRDIAESLGESYGKFVPVSPLVAEMVSNTSFTPPPERYRNPIPQQNPNASRQVIEHIRLGAARQHLDYVLVYEVATATQNRSNALSIADVSIIGMFTLPSRNVEVTATASGILLDVRNGYPYATLTGFAEKNGVARLAYADDKQWQLGESATVDAVAHLALEAKDALTELAARQSQFIQSE